MFALNVGMEILKPMNLELQEVDLLKFSMFRIKSLQQLHAAGVLIPNCIKEQPVN
jgi:hypothetical protein